VRKFKDDELGEKHDQRAPSHDIGPSAAAATTVTDCSRIRIIVISIVVHPFGLATSDSEKSYLQTPSLVPRSKEKSRGARLRSRIDALPGTLSAIPFKCAVISQFTTIAQCTNTVSGLMFEIAE